MTMLEEPVRLAVIVGSAEGSRFAPVLTNWFAGEAKQRPDLTLDIVDLAAEARLPMTRPVRPPSPNTPESLAAISLRLDAADAFVVVTPEYNHSFPALLKNAIDWHLMEWRAKPVGFVCYGGRSGGLRAVEQLRQVFGELHAVSIRDTLSFHGTDTFDEQGRPKDQEGCDTAARLMLDQLVWWALALRDARTKRPYHG
jgi:NAD(P)H-dependent FMN reductase